VANVGYKILNQLKKKRERQHVGLGMLLAVLRARIAFKAMRCWGCFAVWNVFHAKECNISVAKNKTSFFIVYTMRLAFPDSVPPHSLQGPACHKHVGPRRLVDYRFCMIIDETPMDHLTDGHGINISAKNPVTSN
jgi:hypothetical protein